MHMNPFAAMAVLALLAAPAAAVAQASSPSSSSPATTPPATQAEAQPAWYEKLFAPDLIGKPVRDAAGNELGEIEEIATAPGSGDLVAVVQSGGVFGLFADEKVVPLGEMQQKDGAYVLPQGSKEKLAGRPDFDEATHRPVTHFSALGSLGK